MYYAVLVVHIIVSLLLVLVVLVQAGRGAELGAAFGGMGQATFGRGQSTFITKFTTTLAVTFMLTSLSLAFMTAEEPNRSVLPGSATTTPAAGSKPVTVPKAETPIPVQKPMEQTDAPVKK